MLFLVFFIAFQSYHGCTVLKLSGDRRKTRGGRINSADHWLCVRTLYCCWHIWCMSFWSLLLFHSYRYYVDCHYCHQTETMIYFTPYAPPDNCPCINVSLQVANISISILYIWCKFIPCVVPLLFWTRHWFISEVR